MTDSLPSGPRRSLINPAPRGRPFEKGQSGNPAGRPLGARNRTTVAAQALLDGKAEAITDKAIEMALSGDINAIRLCLKLTVPPRREQPIEFEIRELTWINDAEEAIANVIAAVAAGKITLAEAAEVVRLIEAYVRTCLGMKQYALSEARASELSRR
jgi:uncharacterized protein DUF5681